MFDFQTRALSKDSEIRLKIAPAKMPRHLRMLKSLRHQGSGL